MSRNQAPIDAATRTQVVQALAEKVKECYVLPSLGEQISASLLRHLGAGEFDGFPEGEFLCLALNEHMQAVCHDEHLWVRWHSEPLPEHDGQLRQSEAWQAERRLEARLDNHGLHRVERLPGNVGYVNFLSFHRPEWGGKTAIAAMNFVASTGALIIDLRQCHGGHGGMIALVLTYLFDGDPVQLTGMYWADDDETVQTWTLPYVPGPRFGGAKPVYVLIGKETFSGGESCAYDLQARKRATLVGEKTDGGAHAGASYRIHPHFEAFIPIGRAINPVTQSNWQGRGVVPDVPVPAEQAWNVAYGMALEAVIAGISPAAGGPLGRLRAEARRAQAGLESAKPG